MSKRIVITINKQTTEREHLKIFKAMPDVDIIFEKDVQYAGLWRRDVYESEGKLKPRKK